jgi:uncharacterized membrane protein
MRPPSPTFGSPKISLRANFWIAVPIGALITAVAINSLLLLDYIHVFTAILWTGTDIFMGFVLGPVLRKVSPTTRKEIITWLMPKMVFYMPTVSSVTTTAGYFLASKAGLLVSSTPLIYWLIAVVVITGILLVQGLGILLPTNLRVYFELRKDEPNMNRVQRLMKRYIRVVASQAAMQFVMIFIMAHLAVGTLGLL